MRLAPPVGVGSTPLVFRFGMEPTEEVLTTWKVWYRPRRLLPRWRSRRDCSSVQVEGSGERRHVTIQLSQRGELGRRYVVRNFLMRAAASLRFSMELAMENLR